MEIEWWPPNDSFQHAQNVLLAHFSPYTFPYVPHTMPCLYRTVLEVNYLFLTDSARNCLFQKTSTPPPHPWKLNDGILMIFLNMLKMFSRPILARIRSHMCPIQCPIHPLILFTAYIHVDLLSLIVILHSVISFKHDLLLNYGDVSN